MSIKDNEISAPGKQAGEDRLGADTEVHGDKQRQ